jgi:hypothetical protein
MHGK